MPNRRTHSQSQRKSTKLPLAGKLNHAHSDHLSFQHLRFKIVKTKVAWKKKNTSSMLNMSQLHSDLCAFSWELASFLFPLTSLCKFHTTIIRPQSHDIIASLHAHGRAGLTSLLTTDTARSVPSSNQLHSCRSWEEQEWIKRFQPVMERKDFLKEYFPNSGQSMYHC